VIERNGSELENAIEHSPGHCIQKQNQRSQHMPWLVGIGLLGSAISVGYYFKFFKHAFMQESEERMPMVDRGWLLLLASLILLLGAMPWAVLNGIF